MRYAETGDPLLVKKAFISHIFHEPITTIEDRMSAEDIDKYYYTALFVIGNVHFRLFKMN